MSYPVRDIEGVGPAYAEKLNAFGIKSTAQLLKKGADPKGRKAIEEGTGIDHGRVLTWVNLCDLMRIKGVATQYSELLEAAGVDTVKELRNRNAANLTEKMAEVNAEKNLCRVVPGQKAVESWVAQAKEMDPAVSH